MNWIREKLRQTYRAAVPRSWMMFRGPADSRAVALTFDDGPHPQNTPAVLDELARHDARATFFLVGSEAYRQRDLVRRIVAEGHSVGHHSWTHATPYLTSATTLLGEVRRCRALLEEILGRPCNLFRPPRGQLTPMKTIGLWQQKQQIVQWNVDSGDCRVNSPDEAVEWVGTYNPQGGDIVLLHDDYAFAPRLISPLTQRVRSAGLSFVTIDEWTPQAAGDTEAAVSERKHVEELQP